jgi:hypothetical protein
MAFPDRLKRISHDTEKRSITKRLYEPEYQAGDDLSFVFVYILSGKTQPHPYHPLSLNGEGGLQGRKPTVFLR